MGFDHGELAADADRRSTTEAELGGAAAAGGYVFQETLRSELAWRFPEFGLAVCEELAENDRHHEMLVLTHDLVRSDRLSGISTGRRIEPHRHLEHRPAQRQV